MEFADRYTRAFVLQFDPDPDVRTGRLAGRVEHLASTQSARFRTVEELLGILADLLGAADQAHEA